MSGIIDQWSNCESTYCYGIMCRNCIARKFSDGESSVEFVRIGTFIKVCSLNKENVLFYIVKNNMQIESVKLICSKADVKFVPENVLDLLFPVEQNARLSLITDNTIAESLGNISLGHRVHVLGPDNKNICFGIVTFKNSISRLGAGIYFGLKLEVPKANLLALTRKISLLEPGSKDFPYGCDVIVAVNQISPSNINYLKEKAHCLSDKVCQNMEDLFSTNSIYNSKEIHSSNLKKNYLCNNVEESNVICSNLKKNGDLNNQVSVGDKVVYLNGDTFEKGIIKWMGNIRNSFKIGVEFENPIGSGTVDNIELFKTKPLHNLILPPTALIKFSDYMTNNTNETFKCKNNIININNNSNNNNNNYYNGSKLEDFFSNSKLCCEAKQKVIKSNSHHCLKHPEKSNFFDDSLLTNDELLHKKHASVTSESKVKNFETHFNQNSKSFDYYKPSEKKSLYQRQCHSVENDLVDGSQEKAHYNTKLFNNTSQRVNNDLLDLIDPNWSKQDQFLKHNNNEKPLANTDDTLNVLQCAYNKASEDFCNGTYPKGICNSNYSEYSSSNESITNAYDNSNVPCSFSDDFGLGSLVEMTYKGEPHYGVIRWIGTLPERHPSCIFAGVEMEEEDSDFTDGTYNDKLYFECNSKKGLFVPLSKCRKDSRFSEDIQRQNVPSKINYGQIECPIVEGVIPPINAKGDLRLICGKNRGIQGHHNSCYLDATLFSMFAFTCVFDSLLYRPPTKHDVSQYSEVQKVLRDEIVNPLRKNFYVRADRVMKLRTLLDKLSSVSGLTSEEKDPEEFLNSLLAQILKAEPFLKLSSGQDAFHYQLFVEKDERLVFPSVQQLFEQSFVTSDIKLKQVPPCLIIQMPRFGKSFKMYSKILPPQLLDVTDVIENSPRQCTVCGKSAQFECKDCFGQSGIGNELESISFCKTCLDTAHSHHSRISHNYKALTVPVEFSELQEHCIIPRLYMELFAVVCIETSHYVAFVKCGSGLDAPWCFFDSMADRKGEQYGYNIPEIVPCPNLPYWLSEDGAKMLSEMRDERHLPEHAKRLFSDAYMCMYQSPDMMMYR